jgi:hypothetical protein
MYENKLTIKMYDCITKEKSQETCDVISGTENIEKFLNDLSEKRPNTCITAGWHGQNGNYNTIMLTPYNQKIDEKRLDKGEMTMQEFIEKWYGQNFFLYASDIFQGITIDK